MSSTFKIIIGVILCLIVGSFILKGLKLIFFLAIAAGIGYLAIKFIGSKSIGKAEEKSTGGGNG